MKKRIAILVAGICLLLNGTIYAQVTVPTNVSPPGTQFVGWDGTGPGGAKHLDIKNEWGTPWNIRFFTNGSPGNERGTILGANGNWGIGNTANFTPQSLLHLAVPTLAQNVLTQWTNFTTGNGLGQGLQIGIGAFGNALIDQHYNKPIDIYTGNNHIAQFTANNSLGGGFLANGDGLKIVSNQVPPGFDLDLWVDAPGGFGYGTHVKWDGSGLIQGATTRFEVVGNYNGLWFNARRTNIAGPTTPRIIFNIDNVNNNNPSTNNEIARFSNNGILGQIGMMRIGYNTLGLDAATRLEVVDNAPAPQLRLSNTSGAIYTDFQTTPAGNLGIIPTNARVGINTNLPTAALDDNGTARIRNLPASALTNVVVADALGNLFVNSSFTGGAGVGTCGSPTVLGAGNGAINMNNVANVYFLGNGNTSTVNSVLIGNACGALPKAKLDVRQSANATATTGIFIENTNAVNGTLASSIGIKSLMSNTTLVSGNAKTIAGWFEAESPSGPGQTNAAIVVPNAGGIVSIGYASPFPAASKYINTTGFPAILEIGGDVFVAGGSNSGTGYLSVSDSILKTNVADYKHGLDVIRQINPITYQFNGKGRLPKNKTILGVMAQQIANVSQISSLAIDTLQLRLDTADANTTSILTTNHDALFFAGINAIKQLDSTVSTLSSGGVHTSSAGTSNLLAKFTSSNTIANSQVFDDGNNVAIGSATPAGKMQVSDNNNANGAPSLPMPVPQITVQTGNNGGQSAISFLRFNNDVKWTMGWSGDGTVGTGAYQSFRLLWSPTTNYTDLSDFNNRYVSGGGLQYGSNTAMSVSGGSLNVGLGGLLEPQYALDVNGTVRANLFIPSSDQRYKTNIANISGALDKIKQLTGRTFYYDTISFSKREFTSQKQIGLIAQEVLPVVPEIVYKDSAGYYSLDYDRLVALLIEGMKDQQAQIDSLKNSNSQNSNNNKSFSQNIPTTDVTLETAAMLFQNTPNPFGNQTSIGYILPDKVQHAEMVFYDEYGNELKHVVLNDRGKAKIDVDAQNLASGIYSYSLIVDGKMIDTRKMIRTK